MVLEDGSGGVNGVRDDEGSVMVFEIARVMWVVLEMTRVV